MCIDYYNSCTESREWHFLALHPVFWFLHSLYTLICMFPELKKGWDLDVIVLPGQLSYSMALWQDPSWIPVKSENVSVWSEKDIPLFNRNQEFYKILWKKVRELYLCSMVNVVWRRQTTAEKKWQGKWKHKHTNNKIPSIPSRIFWLGW